jgi:hypothetical protein
MEQRLHEVCIKIEHLKKTLSILWQQRGKTDQDVLNLAGQIDDLINKYDRLAGREISKRRI